MREVSRRKEVECFKCGEKQMVPVKLTYEKYAYMTPQERGGLCGKLAVYPQER